MRPPVSALFVPAMALLASACMVTVFVKDAGGEGAGAGSSGSSGADDSADPGAAEMSSETGPGGGATTGPGDATSGVETLMTTALGFDVGEPGEWEACSLYLEPCDGDSDAVDHALGLNCAHGLKTSGPLTTFGAPESLRVIDAVLGTTSVYAPVEGSRRVLLSTGVASHALLTRAELPELAGCPMNQTCPSSELPEHDLLALPPPLDPTPQSCPEGQPVPGSGDCSETVLEQWGVGGDPLAAYDYTELRFSAVAPNGTTALAFQFAFLTAEYPPRYPGTFNDLFVAWVASERYTGNVALDPDGNPIGAVTLPYTIKLDPMPVSCEPDCPDVPLRGFAFEGHAGTEWLPGSAPTGPGESVEVVFALFDVGDAKVDSAVLLDAVRWVCAPPPSSL